MQRKTQRAISTVLRYSALLILGYILIFPLIYMVASSFKTNNEIFASKQILPQIWSLDGYIQGWRGAGQFSFGHYMLNSFRLTLPTVLFTVLSSVWVAYGFSRFTFPLKKLLFGLMMALMMLPSSVLIIPRYLLFMRLTWVDTYLPFYVPSIFATSSFFIYMFIQFFRGLPRELDEAATIDGCGSMAVLIHILLPLCTPVIISAAIFQFIWTWNDFMSQYIYISSVSKYTVSQGLRMAIDGTARIDWSNVLAMSVVSMIPSTLVFLVLQRYFVEGIATSGLKG